jgi:hypothetical protein
MLTRFALVWAVFLTATMLPVTANAQRSSARSAYDLEQLHPDVRAAAAAARAVEASAMAAAARAREAAALAEDAAQRARNGEEGYNINAREGDPQRRHYEGGWGAHGGQGLGILTFGAGEFQGDRYAGGFSCARKHGFGVYRYAPMSGDRAESRFEGQYNSGRWSGLGVYSARDGAHFVGEVAGPGMSGVGIHSSANGQRYEGQFANNAPNGYGVLWDARGRVRRAGIFRDARLVTRLTANMPTRGAIEPKTESTASTCAESMAEPP